MATTIESSVEIAESPARVWAVLADLDRLGDYDPVVVKSVVIGDQHIGVGARRRCNARQRRYFVERVTEWVEPTRLQLAILECNLPTKNLTQAHA